MQSIVCACASVRALFPCFCEHVVARGSRLPRVARGRRRCAAGQPGLLDARPPQLATRHRPERSGKGRRRAGERCGGAAVAETEEGTTAKECVYATEDALPSEGPNGGESVSLPLLALGVCKNSNNGAGWWWWLSSFDIFILRYIYY